MHKYISIMDISKYRSYANVAARLVYLHAACHVDTSTYTCVKSTRQMAKELGLTHAQTRHALAMLETDGLIETQVATHQPTHYATHLMTQPTTHIHIVRVNELDGTSDGTNDTPSDTPNRTPNRTESRTQNKGANTRNVDTHTMRAHKDEFEKLAREAFGLLPDAAAKQVDTFFERQELKAKRWESEGDALAHFVSWIEKRVPRPKAMRLGDHEARTQEYNRTKEAEAERTQAEREAQEIADMKRHLREYDAMKDNPEAMAIAASIRQELKKRKAI